MKACDNPFATDRVERLLRYKPDWIETDWASIEDRWSKLNRRVTLTGRHGSGKTTFLDTWQERLTSKHQHVIRIFLNRETRSLTSHRWEALNNPADKIILLDGEEQLDWSDRRKFYRETRTAAGLLVTRHKKGKLPTLLHLEPDINILDLCVQHLAPAHYSRLAPYLPTWWRQSSGNIRQVLLNCYDILADTPSEP